MFVYLLHVLVNQVTRGGTMMDMSLKTPLQGEAVVSLCRHVCRHVCRHETCNSASWVNIDYKPNMIVVHIPRTRPFCSLLECEQKGSQPTTTCEFLRQASDVSKHAVLDQNYQSSQINDFLLKMKHPVGTLAPCSIEPEPCWGSEKICRFCGPLYTTDPGVFGVALGFHMDFVR